MYKDVVTIGLMPTRRPVFKFETAKKEYDVIMPIIRSQMTKYVKFVDVDDICEGGMGTIPSDIPKVVKKFKAANVDALFFPFCDFGCEEVVASVAKQFKLPTLIWGTRDKVSTYEVRQKETQCGLFAATKVLMNYNVKYSYIWNCEADSPDFVKGFEKFVRVASVLKNLRNMNVAEIGDRPRDFYSVIHNQLALIQNFDITVKPIPLAAITDRANMILEKKDKELTDYYAEFTSRIDCNSGGPESYVWKVCAGTLAIEQLMKEHNCRCAAFDCGGVSKALNMEGGCGCAIEGELADRGLPTACETDVWGAISALIASSLTLGEDSPFLADWTYRHPTNDNAELIWHGGPFAYSLAKKDSKPKLHYTAANNRTEPWWEMKQGDLSLLRMDEHDGKYYMFCGEGKTTEGPETTGTWVWMEVDDWKKWEEKLMLTPYIHHVAGVYGHYYDELREIAKYLGVIFETPDSPGYKGL